MEITYRLMTLVFYEIPLYWIYLVDFFCHSGHFILLISVFPVSLHYILPIVK